MLNRPSSECQALHACLRISFCVLLLLTVLFPHALWAQDIAQVKKGVVKITAQVEGKSKIGSGIIVKLEEDHAYILTASHVIEGDPQPANVTFSRRLTALSAPVYWGWKEEIRPGLPRC